MLQSAVGKEKRGKKEHVLHTLKAEGLVLDQCQISPKIQGIFECFSQLGWRWMSATGSDTAPSAEQRYSTYCAEVRAHIKRGAAEAALQVTKVLL